MTNKKKILDQKDIDNWETCENGIKIFPEHSEFGCGCVFDDNCKFGINCDFGNYSMFSSRCEFGDGCKFGCGCKFGNRCKFGNDCDFGNDCNFGVKCVFPAYYNGGQLVNTCMFGNHCAFMQEVKTEDEKQGNTQPKFTPGPWRRSAFEDDWAIRCAKCDRVIARPNCNFDDASANAALIAAAPEMYEVLERAYTALWDDGYMYNKSQKLRADISTVLAKARGEVAK